ncbi:hypothetical protein Y1Q_0023475 [Alligator mississippiensis]|uniref:Uncharacterized protein n=1 Tax=Alligator mississippiensis TaxID=8496 RepID=A0A151NQ77_ALLMI|nr:hypothetical protein Y1Q_0023475 [Alligator mississippiensis]
MLMGTVVMPERLGRIRSVSASKHKKGEMETGPHERENIIKNLKFAMCLVSAAYFATRMEVTFGGLNPSSSYT